MYGVDVDSKLQIYLYKHNLVFLKHIWKLILTSHFASLVIYSILNTF